MERMIAFVNIFCCPVLALWMYYRRKGQEIEINGNSLCIYAIFVACNMPLTKGLVVILKLLTKILVSLDSTYYTVLSLITAFLIPYLYEMITKNFSVRCKIERNLDEKH